MTHEFACLLLPFPAIHESTLEMQRWSKAGPPHTASYHENAPNMWSVRCSNILLNLGPIEAPMAQYRRSGKLAVILHADIAGSSTLVQQDERLAHERIQETFHRFGDIITQYHGRVCELRGDALLAEFERASDAVTAALALQSDQSKYNAQLNDDIRPSVRAGIAMGEVIIADNTVTGAGVVLAQRVEQLADPGGVVIQGAAYETIPGRFPFEYVDLGEHGVKGFNKPVRAYSANLKGDAGIPPPEQTDHRFRNTVVASAFVNIDITTCETCGGAVKVIASIEDPALIKQILAYLQRKAESKEFNPLPESRAPPQGSLFG